MEALTLLGSALTIIGTLAGGGVWLMKMNFRLSQQTLKAKKDLYEERFENLKAVVQKLEFELSQHRSELIENSARAKAAIAQLEKTEKQMTAYASATEKKIESFESVLVKLSNDLVMVKTKSKGSQ